MQKHTHREIVITWSGIATVLFLGTMVSPAIAAPGGKLQLCHYPPDNRSKPMDITVGAPALAEHLAHGDFQGTCAEDCRLHPSICDDNSACTADVCGQNGTCSHAAVSCNDNNACTADSCNAATGCTFSAISCNDNSACTTDSCDPLRGCQFNAISCDDADACTSDSCNPTTGCGHARVSCDDGSQCSVDSCNPSTGCAYGMISCDDHDPCTADSCTNATGCQNEPVVCPTGQICAPTNGACQPLPYKLTQTYTTACSPYNYQTLDLQQSYSSFNSAYLACAQRCESIKDCSQIWVGYQTAQDKGGPYGCYTGKDESVDPSHGWNSGEIQCNLPSLPYPQYGEWYDRVKP